MAKRDKSPMFAEDSGQLVLNETEKKYKANVKRLERFAKAFTKLKVKFPEVVVSGDQNGFAQATIHGLPGEQARAYLSN